jgi:hypothetical protein
MRKKAVSKRRWHTAAVLAVGIANRDSDDRHTGVESRRRYGSLPSPAT